MPRFSFLLRLPVLLFLVHTYVAARLASGMPDGFTSWGIAAAMVCSYLILMAGFIARDKVGERLSDTVSWAGFVTLGLFSWFFVLTVLRDILLVLLFFLESSTYFEQSPWLATLKENSAIAVCVLSLAACVWGLFSARRRPAVVDLDIAIPNLPSAFDGFRIVQLTDLHVGPTIKRRFVQKVVDICNHLDGDVIVLTGDLVDGKVERLAEHTFPLSRLNARHGVFAVTGNHEYYVGVGPWIDELERLGIAVLLNSHHVIQKDDDKLVLAGVADFGAEKFHPDHASDPVKAIRDAPGDAGVKILLAHQPRSIFAASPLGFDLQLSGHTHGGQFWPWNHFVPLQQPFVAGLHRHENMQIYISRGTGYWGPPLRFGARSEISYIRLRRA